GYGHTGPDVRTGMTISEDRADELLDEDLVRFEDAVSSMVKVPLNDNQFGALVSFAYNIGVGAFSDSTLLKKLNAGNYDVVPGELAKWIYAGGEALPGLINRRRIEGALFAAA